ncbi:MAG: triose-phosphate isomerase, partial [Acidimicrobiaceae bacterium]|nr:triose-phosphate isomerase [Acidimicrobiaceae bacterium]
PAFTALRSVQTVIESDDMSMALGAQNVHWEDEGRWTGEVSAPMLAKLNVRYVIVGHSERRQHFGEDDETVNRKLRAVLKAGMTPILCVGETIEQHDAGEAENVVLGHLAGGLRGVDPQQVAGIVVAYEPIWAIGTGRNATVDDAQAVCAAIRAALAANLGRDVGDSVRIQYGGSVNQENAAELLSATDIDGALVGSASLDPEAFAAIVAACPA